MTAPDRAALVRLVRAELADCESSAATEDARINGVQHFHGPSHQFYPLTLVRVQFYAARAAAWRDFGRRLRDLLAEMGETP
jgi:hypothetical protein